MADSRPHSFRIPEVLWNDLAGCAAGRGDTITAVVIAALEAFLAAAPDGLSAEDAELARETFARGAACLHCGGIHLRACPRVKRLSWRNKEDLAEVEYWPAGRWDPGDTVFPEDVFDAGDDINHE